MALKLALKVDLRENKLVNKATIIKTQAAVNIVVYRRWVCLFVVRFFKLL